MQIYNIIDSFMEGKRFKISERKMQIIAMMG